MTGRNVRARTRSAVVAVACLSIAVGGCATGSSPAPAEAPASTARPSGPLPIKVGTALGTYATTSFQPQLTLTVASDGWLFPFVDDDDEAGLIRAGDLGLYMSRIGQVVDPTSHQPVAAPDDLVAWLAAHPDLEAGSPGSATLAGSDVAWVDVAAVGDDVEIFAFPTGNLRVSAGTTGRFWVLPLEGPDLVVSGLAPTDAFDAAIPDIESIVETIKIEGA